MASVAQDEKLNRLFSRIQGHERAAFSLARRFGGCIARLWRKRLAGTLGDVRKRTPANNHDANAAIEKGVARRLLSGGYIENQRAAEIASMRIGTASLAKSGCGAVAAYNVLVFVGMRPSLADVLEMLEKHAAMLHGELGCDPFQVVRCLQRLGCRIAPVPLDEALHEKTSPADGYVVSFWNDRDDIAESAHTVALLRAGDGLLHAHNDASQDGFSNVADFIATHPKARPIMVAAVAIEKGSTAR